MTPLAKAAYWVQDYVYAGLHQAQGMVRRSPPDRYRSQGSKRPIVLLPGIWETWHFLRPLVEHLHGAGHPVHVVADLGWNGGTVDAAATLTADYLRRTGLTDVAIVAHSKGGLIGKAVMLFDDEGPRVDSMVAIASPFSGSVYGRFAPIRSLRAFSPNDPTTVRLGANREVNSRITSIFAEFDPHIPGGSELPGATNVRIPVAGHFRILDDPRTISAVDDALARTA